MIEGNELVDELGKLCELVEDNRAQLEIFLKKSQASEKSKFHERIQIILKRGQVESYCQQGKNGRLFAIR